MIHRPCVGEEREGGRRDYYFCRVKLLHIIKYLILCSIATPIIITSYNVCHNIIGFIDTVK